MKLKLQSRTTFSLLTALLTLAAFAPGAVQGQGGGVNPVTGLPPGAAMPGSPAPQIDPQTGLPMAQAMPEWKDPDWKDPEKVLTNVVYEGLPLAEVARNLREEFRGEFDIVLPKNWGSVVRDPVTGIPQRVNEDVQDWGDTPIQLQLKNVTASEIFNAMNLAFENDRVPLRWELKLIGKRRIALLRVLVDPIPRNPAENKPQVRRVYFVGNLIGDEKSGGMTMEGVVTTITEIWQMPGNAGGNLQFHKDAQLLIVTGNEDQINFIQDTLRALQSKVDSDRGRRANLESKARTNETKAGSSPSPK